MQIEEFFLPESVVAQRKIGSKKRALEQLSELLVAASPGPTQIEVFAGLVGRERLGSTGLGHGAAIPHGRLKGVGKPVCALLQLREGVDFDAVDNQPVDLICALLVPEEATSEHLELLSMLAEIFGDEHFCMQLRAATSDEVLHQLLMQWQTCFPADQQARPCA
ncbi:MAG: PTS sugar transporter subunit IIA [Thiotrichales bacterium]|nr:MAG: PTS sugar transporter subunit IIA [Thiotrichales bacterium]